MLNRIARLLAAEIDAQQWDDCHYRLDGARHNRARDSRGKSSTIPLLTPGQAETVKANVAWVVAQALYEDDPETFGPSSVAEFFVAAGVDDAIIHTKRGAVSGGLWAGIRES